MLFSGACTSGGEADLGAPSGGAVTANAVTEGVSLVFRTLPQSKIGSEEPIFASPLSEGAKIAPHRGGRAKGPKFHYPTSKQQFIIPMYLLIRWEGVLKWR